MENQKSEPVRLCHIAEEAYKGTPRHRGNIHQVRKNVCRDLELIEHKDGNLYCCLHLPESEEKTELFWTIVRERMNETQRALFRTGRRESKLNFTPKSSGTAQLVDDFRFVWFPEDAQFIEETFHANVDFSFSTFPAGADFSESIFEKDAIFKGAKFFDYAEFNSCKFNGEANFGYSEMRGHLDFSNVLAEKTISFENTIFKNTVSFNDLKVEGIAKFGFCFFFKQLFFESAEFKNNVDFGYSFFNGSTSFRFCEFFKEAGFSSAFFNAYCSFENISLAENREISFKNVLFKNSVNFDRSVLKGSLYFEAGIGEYFKGALLESFRDDPWLIKQHTEVFEGEMRLAHSKITQPAHIIFNRTRLRPSWLVNVDSRKFTFTDIKWENHKGTEQELNEELVALVERDYLEPHNIQLLTISFRNLAANAEEHNRLEEASGFRRSAFECERLLRKSKRSAAYGDILKGFQECIKCRSLIFCLFPKLREILKNTKPVVSGAIHFLYRWLSFYGESWIRALCWLLAIWIVPAVIYWFCGALPKPGSEPGNTDCLRNLGFLESLLYSLKVMTFQKPDGIGKNIVEWVAVFQIIAAPVQTALLALAIRRKFLR